MRSEVCLESQRFPRRGVGGFLTLACLSIAAAALPVPTKASLVYITDFTKDNNICASLNRQFPNSDNGSCPSTGFEVGGAPGASFDYVPSSYTSPNAVSGFPLVNNGVDFHLVSNSSGFDFEQICVNQFSGCNPTLAVNAGVLDATNVYLLMGAYFGQSFNITLNGTGGVTQTFNNISVPDFCGNHTVNSSSGGVTEFTTFEVSDVGGCATGNSATGYNTTYNVTEVGLALSPAFNGQTLDSFTITANGNTVNLYGATVASSLTAVPEPSAWPLLALAGALIAWRRRAGNTHRDQKATLG